MKVKSTMLTLGGAIAKLGGTVKSEHCAVAATTADVRFGQLDCALSQITAVLTPIAPGLTSIEAAMERTKTGFESRIAVLETKVEAHSKLTVEVARPASQAPAGPSTPAGGRGVPSVEARGFAVFNDSNARIAKDQVATHSAAILALLSAEIQAELILCEGKKSTHIIVFRGTRHEPLRREVDGRTPQR